MRDFYFGVNGGRYTVNYPSEFITYLNTFKAQMENILNKCSCLALPFKQFHSYCVIYLSFTDDDIYLPYVVRKILKFLERNS